MVAKRNVLTLACLGVVIGAASPALAAITTSGSFAWSGTVGTSDLTLGNLTSVGGASVDSGGAAITGLKVDNTTGTSTLSIDAGATLTTTSAATVILGANVDQATTGFNASGDGAWTVSAAAFQVGGGTGGSSTSPVTNPVVDMSGLAVFSSTTTGIFRMGDGQGGASSASTMSLTLAKTSTITASTITIGDVTGATVASLKLGSAANTLNADTITLGATGPRRSSGSMTFAGSTGSISMHGTNGTARVGNFNLVTSSGTTGASLEGTAAFAGHTATLLISSLNMAYRTSTSPAGGTTTATFSFDKGTLDITSVTMGKRARTSGAITSTLNLGSASSTASDTMTIGAGGIIAATTLSTGNGNGNTANINIGGGTVTIGQTGGTSIVLGDATGGAGGTATASLNITGGTTTVAGDIVSNEAAGGVVTSTVLINGGLLNIGTHAVTNVDTLNLQSGTLQLALAGTGAGQFGHATIGNLTLASRIEVGLNSFTPAANDVFDLFNWNSLNASSFNVSRDLVLPSLGSGLGWDSSSFLTSGEIKVIAVPEPVGISVVVGSLVLLARRRRSA